MPCAIFWELAKIAGEESIRIRLSRSKSNLYPSDVMLVELYSFLSSIFDYERVAVRHFNVFYAQKCDKVHN